jgi:uncharacterized protein Smg (DUF494 family)
MSDSALELFRSGFDYVEIANMLRTTEAEVEKQIHAERDRDTNKARMRVWRREYMRRQRAEKRA